MYRLPRIKFQFVFLALITIVSLSGCEFKDVQLDEIESFEVHSVKRGRLDATLRLTLTNPNRYSILVSEADFKLSMGPTNLGDARLRDPFTIEGSSTKTYSVDIDGNLGNLLAAGLGGLGSFLSGTDPEVLIKGDLKVGKWWYKKQVHIEEKTSLPIRFN